MHCAMCSVVCEVLFCIPLSLGPGIYSSARSPRRDKAAASTGLRWKGWKEAAVVATHDKVPSAAALISAIFCLSSFLILYWRFREDVSSRFPQQYAGPDRHCHSSYHTADAFCIRGIPALRHLANRKQCMADTLGTRQVNSIAQIQL